MDQNTACALARRIAQRAQANGIAADVANPDIADLVIDCIDAGVDPMAVLVTN